jgi:transporter family-2 protein
MVIWLVILVALIGGAAVAVQAQLLGFMGGRLGNLEAVFVTYGVGGVIAGMLILVARGGNLQALRELPGYTYLAGACGLVVVGTISWSVARLGVVRGLLLVTAAQFLLSAVIDHFGLLGADVRTLDLSRIAGIALFLVGAWLVLR